MIGPYRFCECPKCGIEWWHIQPADHIVCPLCCTELTFAFSFADSISVRKVLPDGTLGPNLIHDSREAGGDDE